MKIPIQENSVNINDLKQKVADKFPDKIVSERSKNFIVVKFNSTVGVNIVLRKKSIMINGDFPTMGGKMLFTILMLVLGILLPLIVYFSVFFKKHKTAEKEIGNFIQNKFLAATIEQ